MEFTSLVSKERILEEYDITFTNGQLMSVAICKEEGDSVDFDTHPSAVRFHIMAKVSPLTGKEEFPAEHITVFTNHIFAIQHRIRTIQPLTAEQKSAWHQTVKEMSKTVQ